MQEIINREPFQAEFADCLARYPALIASIATGKTMFMLWKIWEYCDKFPDSLALVVRKNYVDLRDSTLKDFTRYFDSTVDGNKEYHFANGSCIMFRHGDELNVLKNINLSIFAIEQAEEFESEETFTFLRDRLRRDNAPYRQGIVIGNTNGHNWIWKLWKNNPPSQDFTLYEANTFDNQDNLPKDFIEDLKNMEKEAPNHYRRYVMNSWEDVEDADLLILYHLIEKATQLNLFPEGQKILSCDVARFGDDETVISILQKANAGWKQIYLQGFKGQDTVQTVGRIIDLRREFRTNYHVVDDIGVGGGVTDMLREVQLPNIRAFVGNAKPTTPEFYSQRDECYWKLKELFDRGQIQIINNEKLKTQLSSIRFEYRTNGQKKIISKDDMKDLGFSSPDYADALSMAMSVLSGASQPKIDYQKTLISHYPRP